MGYWHEAPRKTDAWRLIPKPRSRVVAAFRGDDVRKAPWKGYFLRYEGEGKAPNVMLAPWRRNPEGWFELWPLEPMLASSPDEAKALAQPLLPHIEDGSLDALFEKRPYQPPATPQLIKEIEHATHQAQARIVQYPDGLYAVNYVVYAPNGRYFPASSPSISADLEFEWGVAYAKDENYRQLRTWADDPESAEEIAVLELNQFVEQDPEIKRR